MAKWRFATGRKAVPHAAGHNEPSSAVSAERTKISKGYRSPGRFRYDSRVDGAHGWKASFMSF